ncbi:hypothetical protein BDQ17DRAFT_278310 [Cyathus striatus]|nr:hypothetical protein BDQ17DRAFT_278310 [Cyathus striatus]
MLIACFISDITLCLNFVQAVHSHSCSALLNVGLCDGLSGIFMKLGNASNATHFFYGFKLNSLTHSSEIMYKYAPFAQNIYLTSSHTILTSKHTTFYPSHSHLLCLAQPLMPDAPNT